MTSDKPETQPAWWFNLSTGKVEFGLKTAALNRVGPFQTEAEAEKALEILAKRAAEWHEEDERD